MAIIKRSDINRLVLLSWECPDCKGLNGIRETKELTSDTISAVRCEYCPSSFDLDDK